MLNKAFNIFIYDWWRSIDRNLFITTIILILIGCLISFAATPSIALKYNLEPFFFVKKHFLFAPIAFFSLFFVSLLSQVGIKRFFLFIFITSIFFIIYSLFLGNEIKGSTRWTSFLGYSFQPSEFLKISFIIVCAWIFSLKNQFQGINNNFFSFILYLLISALILLQPDVSMFCIISVVYVGQLIISGIKWRWVIVSATLFGLIFLFAYHILDNVQRRINNFFDHSIGDNYQITKSLQGIKEGGLFGKGPEMGTVKDNLPDAHTDFIFSVIAEEFGLITCLGIMIIFIYLIIRVFKRIQNEKNLFVILSISGLTIQFSFQIFVNIASTIGLIPTTGTTLPFISYGGSSMISMALNISAILALTRVNYKDVFLINEKET